MSHHYISADALRAAIVFRADHYVSTCGRRGFSIIKPRGWK